VVEEFLPFMVDKKQRKRQRPETQYKLQATPLVTHFLPQLSRTSQNSATLWGLSVQHMNLCRTFHIETNEPE
jgi:hypothetical protein